MPRMRCHYSNIGLPIFNEETGKVHRLMSSSPFYKGPFVDLEHVWKIGNEVIKIIWPESF